MQSRILFSIQKCHLRPFSGPVIRIANPHTKGALIQVTRELSLYCNSDQIQVS